jgi:hypothetical protein
MRTVVAQRWTSVFVRWHLQHGVKLALVAHVAAYVYLFVAALSAGERTVPPVTGSGLALFVVLLTVALSAVDYRRMGGPDLMANLGYSRRSLVLLSIAPPVVVELVINAAANLIAVLT